MERVLTANKNLDLDELSKVFGDSQNYVRGASSHISKKQQNYLTKKAPSLLQWSRPMGGNEIQSNHYAGSVESSFSASYQCRVY
ncbi:hypothetical protein ACHQM5_012731 [Ranunculus cassubicifolius]